MAGDALDRLKNRARSAVPPRDTGIIDVKPSPATTTDLEPLQVSTPTSQSLSTSSTSESPTKAQWGVVNPLESVTDRLVHVCSENQISREVFLESAFLLCAHNPKLMQDVLHLAHQRYEAQQHELTVQQERQFAKQNQTNDDMWLL
jgi:hypothetical protein